jgi:hypothetical protein
MSTEFHNEFINQGSLPGRVAWQTEVNKDKTDEGTKWCTEITIYTTVQR